MPRNASLAGSDRVWSLALGEARVRGLCGYGVARDMRAACMRGCRHARRHGSRQNNESWTKLEKRYKEYRNPVLILTPGLQTRLCCRFVENHVSKEWHCWAAAAPKASLTPLSTVSAQRCRAALVAAHLGLTEAPPRSLPSSSSTRGARWRGHG